MRLIVMLSAFLLLAGCAEPAAVTDSPEEDQTTPDAGEGADKIDDQTNETLASFQAIIGAENGTVGVPLNVTLDALADGDFSNATWAISAGNTTVDGVGLPAVANVTFEEAGNHTINATISMEGYQTEILGVNVSIEGVVEEVVDTFEAVTFAGKIDAPCHQCYWAAMGDLCVGFNAGQNERDCFWFPLLPEYFGRAYSTSSAGGDADVAFYSSCSPGNQMTFVGAIGHDNGIIPDGAMCGLLIDWLGTGAISLTVS